MKKKSVVWRFYSEPADKNKEKVRCPSCNEKVIYKGTTSGLKYHLMRKHLVDFNRLTKNSEKEGAIASDAYGNDEARDLLAKSFSTGLIPFKFAENPEFRKFLKMISPQFKIPGSSKVKQLIVRGSTDYVAFLKRDFKSIDKYTVLTDGYSDQRRNFHVYSLHISFIDSNFERIVRFCGLKTVTSGDNVTISRVLNEMIDDVGLSMRKCSSLCSDAGSPLLLMADKHNWDRVHCGCHLLNLIIRDFAEEKTVKNKYMHVSKFARFLSRNKEEKENLSALGKKAGITCSVPLPLPATRWGALSILFDQYVQYYNTASDLSKLKEYLMKQQEMDIVKEIRDLVQPIREGILKLEKDSASSSEIIPSLIFIKKKTEKHGTTLSNSLCTLIERRLDTCLQNSRLLCCMLLDHRYAYKDQYLGISWDTVESCLKFYDTDDEISDDDARMETTVDATHDDDIDSFLAGGCDQSSNTINIENELLRYRALLATNRPSFKSPIEFWRGQKNTFPKLYKIARNLFATPASSSVSERTFSRCTDMVKQLKRNRLTAETMNSILTVSELAKLERADVSTKIDSDSDTHSDSSSESDSCPDDGEFDFSGEEYEDDNIDATNNASF